METASRDVRSAQISASTMLNWSLMPRFVLRSPGFSFAWLTRLRMPRSAALARQIARVHALQKEQQQSFEQEIFPSLIEEESLAGRDKETFRFWYRLARQIRRGNMLAPEIIVSIRERHGRSSLANWLTNWQDTCAQLASLYSDGESAFRDELREKRHALHELVGTPEFQEALWLSNPAMYEIGWQYYCRHWEAGARPFKIKHLERRFYTYLQRFCAKNDTSSFFGPLNYGDFYGEARLHEQLPLERSARRRVFFAYWAVEALAGCIAREPELRPYLCPRRDALRPAPGHQEEGAELYRLSDGRRTLKELARCLQRSCEETRRVAEELAAQGVLHLDIPIPPAILDPLSYLIDKLRAYPASSEARRKWLAVLTWFQQFCLRFAESDLATRQSILAELEARYAELTGIGPRRGQGKMFQDRTLLYEECAGWPENLHLGEAQRERITAALSPIAALCASYSSLLLADLRSAALLLFDELSPQGQPVAFSRFIAAWRRRYALSLSSPRAERLQQRFTELVAARRNGHVCAISTDDLLPLFHMPDMPVVLSPDVFLAASSPQAIAQGRYQVVLGEIHHGVQPVGWMLTFADDAGDWEREISRRLPLPTDTVQPANLLFARHMKTAPPEFPGVSVEVSAVSASTRSLALNQLVVKRQDQHLLLCAPGDSRSLCFYPPSYGIPDAAYAPFACFSYPLVRAMPVRLGEHTPRIEINGTVYQRERWELPSSALPLHNAQGASFRLMADFSEFKERVGLPTHVFVSTPGEPKPVYIDFENYFALELLAHLAGRAETITFVEMWPTGEQLWLHDTNGQYCCELRTVLSFSPSLAQEGGQRYV